MKSSNHLTQEEQRLMDGVSVPFGARQRVQAKFMAMTQGKSKRTMGVSAFIFSGAIAIIALIVGISPQPQGTTGNLSFLEVAHAAYENTISTIHNAYPVHHIVTETIISGADNGPVTEKVESWSLSESSQSFSINQSSMNEDWVYFAKSGEFSYVSQELAAQISEQLSDLDEGGTLFFSSRDTNLEVISANPGYALSFPKNLSRIGSELDPLDSTIACFDFEEKSPEQQKQELLLAQLTQAAGYGAEHSVFDPQQVIALLLEAKDAGQVEDLGIYPDGSGHSQQWYRAVVQIDSESSREVQTTTFGFDPESHRLITVVFVTDDGFESSVTYTTRITTDEFIAINDAHPGLMNPEGQGLVKVTYPIQDLPVYAVEHACYRLNADRPEMLSTEEEAAVRDRIKR